MNSLWMNSASSSNVVLSLVSTVDVAHNCPVELYRNTPVVMIIAMCIKPVMKQWQKDVIILIGIT